MLQAQVAVQRQRVKVRSAENRFKKNWEGLVAMVGSPNLSVSGVAGDLEHDIPALSWSDRLPWRQSRSPNYSTRARIGRSRR